MNKEYFLIDICGTIFNSNTTFDFLKFYFSKKHWYKILIMIRKIKILIIINAIFMRLFQIDLLRYWALTHLKGYTKEQLSSMSDIFYKKYLTKRTNKEATEIIERMKRENKELILVSATLDCIAFAVSKNMNIPCVFSSKLAFKNNKCLGRLQHDLLANKPNVLVDNKINPPYWGIITDNYSDMALIKKSQHVFLIQYSNKKNYWKHLSDKLNIETKLITIYE
jgi:HAD superfamily phosphoserine phosphatase-like hydrolase